MKIIATIILFSLSWLKSFGQDTTKTNFLSDASFFHISLTAKDKETLAKWYIEKLNFRISFRYELPELGLSVIFIALNNLQIEIIGAKEFKKNTRKNPPFHTQKQGFGNVSMAVNDLDAVYKELVKRNVTITSPPLLLNNGFKVMFIDDLEGNDIEFIQLPKQ
jgi:hypothetical protein